MEINDLNLKLKGNIPVTRIELIKLISSWGRTSSFSTIDSIYIYNFKIKECYNLSNLDVSKIKDFSEIFRASLYNGDLSKWNVSNCENMMAMFANSELNNNSLKDWDMSNVKNIEFMFYQSLFNGDISNWDVLNVTNMNNTFDDSPFDGDISKWQFNKDVSCHEIFCDNKNFENKYNDGKKIPNITSDFLNWIKNNKNKIRELNTNKKEVLDFFSFNSNINKELNNDY